jgi:hypothetical protein
MTEEKPELHPVVDLFLRRAESHPEEIADGRWGWVLDNIQQYGSEAEKAAVLPVSNKIMLDNIHKNFMRELLNPEPEQEDLFSKTYQNQALAQAQVRAQYLALAKSMAQTKQEVAERILADAYSTTPPTKKQRT